MHLTTKEWREHFEKLPNDILLEILAVSSPSQSPSTYLGTVKKILVSRGLSKMKIDKEVQERIEKIKVRQHEKDEAEQYEQQYEHWSLEKKNEYKKIKAEYRFGQIRFVIWGALMVISYIGISDSLWWLFGMIVFGIILLGDMLYTGLGTEYAIRGSGFEEKAKKDGLWK